MTNYRGVYSMDMVKYNEAVQAVEKEQEQVTLADRMKNYEVETDIALDKTKPIIVRIDGKKFSSFTSGFKKPFDRAIHYAFCSTCMDLMNEFNPQTIYSQSDEISMIFYKTNSDGEIVEPMFGGRMLKLATLAASFTAARFNHHLREYFRPFLSMSYWPEGTEVSESTCTKSQNSTAYFDARAFNLPMNEVANYIVWRQHVDARRNSTLNYAAHVLGKKKIFGINTPTLRKMLEEAGKPWEKLPFEQRLGFFIKKSLHDENVVNKKTGETITVKRSKPVDYYREITNGNTAEIDWLLANHVDEDKTN